MFIWKMEQDISKKKKHFIFKENINFWESRGFNRLALLITDQVISESEYLNFVFVQCLQVLKHKLQLYKGCNIFCLVERESFMWPAKGYTPANESELGGYALWAVFHRCIFCFYRNV